MNVLTVSGFIVADPEERISAFGNHFLNFELGIEEDSGRKVIYIRVSYFLAKDSGDWRLLGLRAGVRVLVSGSLKFGTSFFIATREIGIIAGQPEPRSNEAIAGRGAEDDESLWQIVTHDAKPFADGGE